MKKVFFYDFKGQLAFYILLTSFVFSALGQAAYFAWEDLSVLLSLMGLVLLSIAAAVLVSIYPILSIVCICVGVWWFSNFIWAFLIGLLMAGIVKSWSSSND
ncbi:MAG: hypothetical protein U9N57_01170 [Pseudomonadota bacterium]|nr:hypothetical protein [Pseudomonadota bacterium]